MEPGDQESHQEGAWSTLSFDNQEYIGRLFDNEPLNRHGSTRYGEATQSTNPVGSPVVQTRSRWPRGYNQT